jgi:hypothetical protein
MSALEVFYARHTKHKLRLSASNPVTLKMEPVCFSETSTPTHKLRVQQLGRKDTENNTRWGSKQTYTK